MLLDINVLGHPILDLDRRATRSKSVTSPKDHAQRPPRVSPFNPSRLSLNRTVDTVSRRPSNVTNLARISGLLPQSEPSELSTVSQPKPAYHKASSTSVNSQHETAAAVKSNDTQEIQAASQSQDSRAVTKSEQNVGTEAAAATPNRTEVTSSNRVTSVVYRSKSFNVTPDPQLRFYQGLFCGVRTYN